MLAMYKGTWFLARLPECVAGNLQGNGSRRCAVTIAPSILNTLLRHRSHVGHIYSYEKDRVCTLVMSFSS